MHRHNITYRILPHGKNKKKKKNYDFLFNNINMYIDNLHVSWRQFFLANNLRIWFYVGYTVYTVLYDM